MTKIQDISKEIIFIEESHKYFTKSGLQLEAVSNVLSLYKNVFDPYGHITRACAKKENISVQEIKDKWEREKQDACDRGHRLHSQLEHYIKNGEILKEDYQDIVKQFSKVKFTGKLHSEVRLFSKKYDIAGTSDLVEELDGNIVNVADFKQNKKISTFSKYKNKLLYPLDNRDECEFEIYTYQMNLYSLMLKEHGYKTNKMTLYYFSPKTREMEIFDVPKREKETIKLLKHYKSLNNF